METELKDSSANTAADFATAADKDKLPLLKPNSNPSDAPTVTSESIEELEKKYAAYVRNDAYGTMGRRELLLNEKVMLGFALITLVPIRLVIGILILLVYYLICLFCTLFKDPNRGDEQGDYAHLSGWRRDVVLQCGRWLSRAMLFNFGFYWLNETRRDSLDEMDKIFTKIAKATHSTGTRPSSSTTDSSSTPDETSRPEETYQVLVQRCMEICDEPCISIPGLSDEEVWALPLPEKMLHDKKRRDKKNMSKQIVYESKLNEFVTWLIEIYAQIDAAKRRGDNLHHFLSEGGRGPNDETTKRLKDGRRVHLDWQIGVPTEPGRWPTYFIRYIGILVRNCEH